MPESKRRDEQASPSSSANTKRKKTNAAVQLDLRQRAQREALVRARSRIYGAAGASTASVGAKTQKSSSSNRHRSLQHSSKREQGRGLEQELNSGSQQALLVEDVDGSGETPLVDGQSQSENVEDGRSSEDPVDSLAGEDAQHEAEFGGVFTEDQLQQQTSGRGPGASSATSSPSSASTTSTTSIRNGLSHKQQLRLVSSRRLPQRNGRSARTSSGHSPAAFTSSPSLSSSTAALDQARSYNILVAHESNFAKHRSKMLSQFLSLRKRIDGQHQRLLEAVNKSATHYADVDELLQRRHDKLSQSLALLLGGVDLAQNKRNFKVMAGVNAVSDDVKTLRNDLQQVLVFFMSGRAGAVAGSSSSSVGGGTNARSGVDFTSFPRREEEGELASGKGATSATSRGIKAADEAPENSNGSLSPLDLDTARELGLLSPKKSTPGNSQRAGPGESPRQQSFLASSNAQDLSLPALDALSSVEAGLKSSVKQLGKYLKRQKEDSKTGSKAFASELASLTAEVRLMASELKAAVAGVAAAQQHHNHDEQHSRAAAHLQGGRAGASRPEYSDARASNVLRNHGNSSSATTTLEVVQATVVAATDRVLKRLDVLDNGAGLSSSSVGGPSGPLAERVEECVRVGEQTLRLLTDSGAATAAALSSTATSTAEQLQRVVDDVQRLGIDTPRFHAGILDQLHRQGTQLDSIQRQLGGQRPGRTGNGLGTRPGADHVAGDGSAGSPRGGGGLLGTFTDLSKAVLAQQDVKFRTFMEELVAAEPERRHREGDLQQLLSAATNLLREFKLRHASGTGVAATDLKKYFASAKTTASELERLMKALDIKLDAMSRDQQQSTQRQLASLQDELQGHASTQNEFTAQWLQQQAGKLNSISTAVDRLLKQSSGKSGSSAGVDASERHAVLGGALGTAAKADSANEQGEAIDELRAALTDFQSVTAQQLSAISNQMKSEKEARQRQESRIQREQEEHSARERRLRKDDEAARVQAQNRSVDALESMRQTLIAEVRGSVETARTGQESATATLRQQFERMLQRSVLRTSEIVGKRVDQTLAAAAEASAEKMESAQLAAETRYAEALRTSRRTAQEQREEDRQESRAWRREISTMISKLVDAADDARRAREKAEITQKHNDERQRALDVAVVERDVLLTKVFQMLLLLLRRPASSSSPAATQQDTDMPASWKHFQTLASIWTRQIDSNDLLPLKVLLQKVRHASQANNSARGGGGGGGRGGGGGGGGGSSTHKQLDRAVAEVEAYIAANEVSNEERGLASRLDWTVDHHPVLEALNAVGSNMDRQRLDLENLGRQLAESARKRSDEALQTLLSEHRQLVGEMVSGSTGATAGRAVKATAAPRGGPSTDEFTAAATKALKAQMDDVVAAVAERVDESVKEALLQHLLEGGGGGDGRSGGGGGGAIKQEEALLALSQDVASLRSEMRNISKQLATLQQRAAQPPPPQVQNKT